jgi:dynamin 1-like protein
VNFFKKAMQPTTKLVTDLVSMQACYVNTTHPDFIGGHKANALVTERLAAAKGPPPANDPKNARAQINNNKDLDVDPKKEDQGFFGSFFATKGVAQKKKGGPVMEAPPPVIRPQAALSERETMETEVIKLLIHSYFNIVKREMIDMVPKAIYFTLVNHSKESLQKELLQELYRPEVLDELLKESEYVVSRRKEVTSMVQALNKAEEIVAGV